MIFRCNYPFQLALFCLIRAKTRVAESTACGVQLLGRALRVDHVAGYKKEKLREDEAEREEQQECNPRSLSNRIMTPENSTLL